MEEREVIKDLRNNQVSEDVIRVFADELDREDISESQDPSESPTPELSGERASVYTQIKNIIRDYFISEGNGLGILVAPTGSGKTSSWVEAVCDILEQEKEAGPVKDDKEKAKRKFFFISPLKRNLPVAQLKKKLVDRKIMSPEEADRQVLMLDSNAGTILKHFEEVRPEIEKIGDIRENEKYINLRNLVTRINNLEKQISQHKTMDLEACKKVFEEHLAQKEEPEFRKALKGYVRKKGGSQVKREEYIRETPGLSWIEKLYPGTFLRDKRIIFMSLDKFLSKNTNIVGSDQYIWKSKHVRGSCLAIDEIDSTKERIYDRIIEDSCESRDVIRLFLSCHSMLTENDILNTIDGLRVTDYSKKRMEKLKNISHDIYTDYKLNYRFVLEEESDRKEDNTMKKLPDFIFTSGVSHTISLSGKKGQAWIIQKGRKNVIEISSDKKKGKASSVREMVARINGFLHSLQNWLLALAINYRDKYNQDTTDNMISSEDAISTATSRLFKAKDCQDYFNEILMSMSFPNKSKNAMLASDDNGTQEDADDFMEGEYEKFDFGFHSRGFSIFEFKNAANHNEDTTINMYEIRESPEKILADLSSRAAVLGLSATGDACTVLKNYDMEYLKNRLGTISLMFSDEQVAPLKDFCSQMRERYRGRINVNASYVSLSGNGDEQELTILLNGNSDLARGIIERHRGKSKGFVWNRYMKICHAFKHFLDHYDDIYLGYMMLNKIPKKNDPDLDLELLLYLFNAIMKQYKGFLQSLRAESIVTILAGESFEEDKSRFFDDLFSNGTSIHKLIVTTYNSAGAGQNMQYEVRVDSLEAYENLVNVSGGGYRHNDNGNLEVDANYIYMEKPTYIVQNKMTFRNDLRSFFKGLVQICSLKESGSISYHQYNILLCDAFRFRANGCSLSTEQDNYVNSAYDAIYGSPDYLGAMELICEQAVGRLCRTTNKREEIHLLLDSDVAGCFRANPVHDCLSTVEFATLKGSSRPVGDGMTPLLNRAILKNNNSRQFINLYLKDLRDNTEKQDIWRKIRCHAVTRPTVDEEEYRKMVHWQQNLYIELPEGSDRYWYRTTDMESFGDCEISFIEKSGFTCVSAEGSFLNEMMKSHIVKEYFETKGFATTFSPKRFILCPIVYNNIYKGALGEFAGEAICKEFDISLGEVRSDAYEFFDYEVVSRAEDGKPVCVDFKNWHVGSGAGENNSQLAHIASKALGYGTDNVIVVNIVKQGDYKPQSYVRKVEAEDGTLRRINITVIPALLRDGRVIIEGIEALSSALSRSIEP